MKPFKYKIFCLILICVFAPAVLCSNFAATAAEPKRIALLPFKINAEKDMSFLQDGIFDMLTTRLTRENEVLVLGRQASEQALAAVAGSRTVNEPLARQIGSRLNADYTLFGSLTVLGNSISIDTKMVDVAGQTPTMAFFEQSQDLGGIITKINQIAAQINQSAFGRQATVASKAAPSPEATAPAPADDTYAHPEKLLKGRGAAGEGGPIIMMGEETESQRFWRSASFKYRINGLDMGDVDGDGKIETVVVTPHSVMVYRSENGKFYKVNESDPYNKIYIIGVDVADINGNGPAEIFVTSLNIQRNALNSFVLEYNGQGYAKIVENAHWYFRVADLSSRGKILLGQKHKYNDAFAADIHEMTWQGNQYVPAETIKTRQNVNILGSAIGDATNSGEDALVAYNEFDYLQIFDAAGKVLWKGVEPFGGSPLYYELPRDNPGGVYNPKYFPMRVLIRQDKSKNSSEVIAVKNYDVARRKLARFRKFNKAHIQSWSWDGVGLRPIWKTHLISGFISDFAIGDFNNSGQPVLIAALVTSEGTTVLTDAKSRIVAYGLPDSNVRGQKTED